MEEQKENRPVCPGGCEEDELCGRLRCVELCGGVNERSQSEAQDDLGIDSTTSHSSDFSDPVYKEIARANGCVNRMSKDELKAKLTELKLDTRGVKDVLRKRLKNYYKKQKLKEPSDTDTYYDYLCVIDFEATCEEANTPDYIHEIIEFPIVLVNTRTLEIVSLET